MLELTISGIKEAEGRTRRIGQRMPVAISRALNRAITSARTMARRKVASDTGLPAKFAGLGMALDQSSPQTLVARLRVSERLIPLAAFTGLKGFRSGKGIAGQSYRLGTVPPGAFFAQMQTGHRGIFRRVGPRRFPIRTVYGPTLPRVIVEKRIFEALQGPARGVFERRLAHETDRLLQGSAE